MKRLIFLLVLAVLPLISAETLSDELLTCGNFNCSNPYDYWAVENVSIYNTSEVAVFSSVFYPTEGLLSQDIGASAYKKYKVEITVNKTWFYWNQYQAEVGGNPDGTFDSEGTKSFYIVSNDTGNFTLNFDRFYEEPMNSFVVVDSISVKEVTDYFHPSQEDFGNVSSCRTLEEPGYYKQIQDINSSVTHCIVIQGDDIIYDGQGYWISGETIYINGGSNIEVMNTNVTVLEVSQGSNLYIHDSIIHHSNISYAIKLLGTVENSTFERLWIYNSSGHGIEFFGIGFGGITGVESNVFKDIVIENSAGNDLDLDQLLGFEKSTNNTFVNCSYSSEYVAGNNILTRAWYYSASVNQPNKTLEINNSANGALCSAYSLDCSNKTLDLGIDGYSSFFLTDYINWKGSKVFFNNYTTQLEGESETEYNTTISKNIAEIWTYSRPECNVSLGYVNSSSYCIFQDKVNITNGFTIENTGSGYAVFNGGLELI